MRKTHRIILIDDPYEPTEISSETRQKIERWLEALPDEKHYIMHTIFNPEQPAFITEIFDRVWAKYFRQALARMEEWQNG